MFLRVWWKDSHIFSISPYLLSNSSFKFCCINGKTWHWNLFRKWSVPDYKLYYLHKHSHENNRYIMSGFFLWVLFLGDFFFQKAFTDGAIGPKWLISICPWPLSDIVSAQWNDGGHGILLHYEEHEIGISVMVMMASPSLILQYLSKLPVNCVCH